MSCDHDPASTEGGDFFSASPRLRVEPSGGGDLPPAPSGFGFAEGSTCHSGGTCPPPAPPAGGRGDEGVPLPSARAQCASARPSSRTSRTAFFSSPDPDDPLLGFAPYLHKAPRGNSITPEVQRAFIAALAASGIVTQAARAVGKSVEALYKLRHLKGAEGFSAAWDMAIDRGMMRLEDCALERAIVGEERPVVSGGQWLGTYTRYDTGLVLFLLRTRRAARYGSGQEVGPGSALYERIRAEILAEIEERDRQSLGEVRESIGRKLEQLRRQVEARRLLEAEMPDAGETEEA